MLLTLKTLLFLEALQVVMLVVCRIGLGDAFRRAIGPTEIVLLLATPVVGLFGQTKSVFYVFAALIPLTAIGQPERLAVRYVLMLVTFPALLEAYIVGGLYLGEISALDFFDFGALVALLTVGQRTVRAVPALSVAASILFAAELLMNARGIPFNAAAREVLISFLGVMLPFLLIAQVVRTRAQAGNVLVAMIVGGVGNAIVAMFETVRHWPLYQSFNSALHVAAQGTGATQALRAGLIRAQSMVSSYETLGLVTALALVVLVAIRPGLKPLGYWLLLGVLAAGCLASQARGAWIAAGVALAVYAVYERRWTLVWGLGGLAAMVAALAVFASSSGRLGQLIGTSGHGEQTAEYRSNLLSRGIRQIVAHPLTGQTRDQLEVSMNDMRQGQHIIDYVNTHLHVALIGGVPLLALWLIAFATPIVLGWRVRGRRGAHVAAAPVGLPLAMIVTCAVFITFTSSIDRIPMLTAIAFGLMSAFLRLSVQPLAAPAGQVRQRPRPSLVVGLPA